MTIELARLNELRRQAVEDIDWHAKAGQVSISTMDSETLVELLDQTIYAKKMAEALLAFSEWLDATANELDAERGGKELATEGSMALTAASAKLAELYAGPDPEGPSPERYVQRIKELRRAP